MINSASSPHSPDSFRQCLAELTGAAYFFACRSCEYSGVDVPGKTKLLQIENIVFYDSTRRTIKPTRADFWQSVAFVTVTFVDTKTEMKGETRSQVNTDHPILCPVRLWGRIVRRILQWPGTSSKTTVNCWFDSKSNSLRFIQSSDVLSDLRRSCADGGGHRKYGYHPHEIGTRSIRSGAAMALFLANESSMKIMLLGRWASDAFLIYIRTQVLEWTANMSQSMLKVLNFHHVAHSLPSHGSSLEAQLATSTRALSSSFIGGTPSLAFPKQQI